jgi:indole-3-glycerol phosphate synthase
MIIDKIIEKKKEEINERKKRINLREIEEIISTTPIPRNFIKIFKDQSLALIAEIKYASPSAGIINRKLDNATIASQYEEGGASAISVLTERNFFKGDLSFIKEVKQKVSLPVLQKDFVVDLFQIYEGRASGADAILIIASILDYESIKDFVELSIDLKLTPFVEIHSEDDLEKVMKIDPPLIGINNRDLKTFKIDLNTTPRLIKLIPPQIKVVSESGIKTKSDVRLLKGAGVNGILVGEALMRSSNPSSMIKNFMNL